jgi:hypothetical protein
MTASPRRLATVYRRGTALWDNEIVTRAAEWRSWKEVIVLRAKCDRLGRDVIIWTSNIDGIQNTDHGVLVRYECLCGQRGELLTGAGSPTRVGAHVELVADLGSVPGRRPAA